MSFTLLLVSNINEIEWFNNAVDFLITRTQCKLDVTIIWDFINQQYSTSWRLDIVDRLVSKSDAKCQLSNYLLILQQCTLWLWKVLTDIALLPTITPLIDQYEQGPVLTSSVPCLVCLSVYLCKTQQQLNALSDFQKIYMCILN